MTGGLGVKRQGSSQEPRAKGQEQIRGGDDNFMELSESYLKAVRRYLPRGQRDDIIAELRVDLGSQIEDKQAELGRVLTDVEQMAIFKKQGDPMAVAMRYRGTGRSLSIGWELIGPELFPAYLILLSCNLVIAAVVIAVVLMLGHISFTLTAFLIPMLMEVVIVTLVFILLNFLRGFLGRRMSESWMWPPAELAHLLPLPRWYSATGFAACGLLTLWWLLIPHFPRLVLGSAAPELKLSPDWHRYYVPVLMVLLVGTGQRAMNVVRPDWRWLLPMGRFVADCAGAIVMFFFRTHALVVTADGVADLARAQHLVQDVNGRLTWGLFGPWLWLYLGITGLVYGWYCLPYVRRFIRGHRNAAHYKHELNGLI